MSDRYLIRVRNAFYFQIAVPAPLREKIEGGRKVIKISLGTGDRRIALQLMRPLVDYWLARFDRLRGRPTPTLPEYALKLPEIGYRIVRQASDEEVSAGLSEPSHDEEGEPIDIVSDADNLPRWAAFAPEIEALERRAADALVAEQRRAIASLGVPAATLAAAVTQIQKQADAKLEKTLKLTRQLTGSPAPPTVGPTFTALLAKWKTEAKPEIRAYRDAEHAVRRFVELLGDMTVSDITKANIRDYAEAIKQLPAVLSGDDLKLPFKKLLDKYDGENIKRVLSSTSAKRLQYIKTLLTFAINLGYIDSSPADNIKISARNERNDREIYTSSELDNIFSSFKSRESEMRLISLIALCTGCRINEILQLTKDDVRCEDGIHFLSINKENGKSTKTKESVRNVPIHKLLIDAGFLEFVASNSGILFYRKQQSFSTTYRRFLNRIGITEYTKVFHSFRHTFKTFCRDAGVQEEVHDALTGHAPARSVGRSYGSKPGLHVLNEAIQRLDFKIKL